MTPEQRRADRGAHKPVPPAVPLPILMPELQRGAVMAFWEDELRLDLAQEAALAKIEGRDPSIAVAEYRKRELSWRSMTCPYLLDGDE